MFIYNILGLPAQTMKEIQIFKSVLHNVERDKIIRIFEWGSGLSTIHYSNYLLKSNVPFEWHSIDNDRVWHQKVKTLVEKKNLESCIWLYLKEFKPFWEKHGWGHIPPPCGIFGPKSENEHAYINFPKQLSNKFDIVIIDARFRRHCIQTAKEVLLPEGVAILHDAHKDHYHMDLEDFKYQDFYESGSWYPFQKEKNKIWLGSMENRTIIKKLK